MGQGLPQHQHPGGARADDPSEAAVTTKQSYVLVVLILGVFWCLLGPEDGPEWEIFMGYLLGAWAGWTGHRAYN